MFTEQRHMYRLIQPEVAWVGALLCASAAFLLLVMTRRRRTPLAMGAHCSWAANWQVSR